MSVTLLNFDTFASGCSFWKPKYLTWFTYAREEILIAVNLNKSTFEAVMTDDKLSSRPAERYNS
jgi:hypothetical protein